MIQIVLKGEGREAKRTTDYYANSLQMKKGVTTFKS